MDNIPSFSKKSNELIMKGAMKQPLKDLKFIICLIDFLFLKKT